MYFSKLEIEYINIFRFKHSLLKDKYFNIMFENINISTRQKPYFNFSVVKFMIFKRKSRNTNLQKLLKHKT